MRLTVSLIVSLVVLCTMMVSQNTLHAQAAATGIPYFQQHVHYSLSATFVDDPQDPSIEGTGTLEYTNNSPDTLRELYFHLYWNLFRHGSYGETQPSRDHSASATYGHGGIDITQLKVGAQAVKYEIDNTIMRVYLPESLLPGAKINIDFGWNGLIPNYTRTRWGWHDHGARNFTEAQWYPQVCVYDNHGWHPDQYIGMGEFYSDYGSFDVTLNLPQRFSTVATTGWSKNAKDVLPDSVRAHLDFARAHPDSIVRISDLSNYQFTPISKSEPMRKWEFHADSVRDFSWCMDESYIWDAVYDNGIMHHALYWNTYRDFWSKQGAKIVLLTIQMDSRFAGQYMYPNAFVCESYEGGMEYPGIVYVGSPSGPYSHGTQGTIMHELGHEWYPMMMGSNETDYGYMDEGFNTFITTFVHEAYWGRWNNALEPGLGFNDDERTSNYRDAILHQLVGNQEPSEEKADMYSSYRTYATATYSHTSAVFFMLRYTMGEHAFDDFMHLYYERWKFKHPYPDDILNAAEDIERREGDTNRVRARGDLRWFFDEWFQKTWKLDYAIDDFDVSGNTATVRIKHNERAVMPLDLVFTFDDGSTEQRWIAVDDWLRTVAAERTYTYTFSKHPTHVEINPSQELLDINRLNNTSCWIPPLQVDLVPKIFGDIKPIDKYAIRSAPFIAPRSGDFSSGVFGWTVLGSYLDRSDKIAVGIRGDKTDEIRLGEVIQYHNVLDCISPWTDVDLAVLHADGQEMYAIRVNHVVDWPGSTTPVHIFNAGYDVSGQLLINGNSSSTVPLNRIQGGYTFHDESASNVFTVAGQVEAGVGDPRTNYSKLAGVIDDRLDMGDWNAFLRFFGGSMQPIGGAIPGQTLFRLASSSDLDHFNDLYGSNFGSDVRDKIRNATESGPLVRGYLQNDMQGRVALSGTLELGNQSLFPFTILRDIPIVGSLFDMFGLTFFADAGLVTDAFCTCQLKSDLMSDAGVGLRFFGANGRLDRALGLDLERTEAQIDFPLYLDKPESGESKFGFRVIGMIRQNF